ncbi:MAG TPA: HDOD domain-containing protein [Quisquiliibacterium sp.]|nr:HDOD domain-containing protein [Quisquiliibacterium sp.]HQN13275.1 HDOD domain-containing protein [Quisquiliibacterium sp.]
MTTEAATDTSASPIEAAHGTLEFLLRRMRLKPDFPALSESIRKINALAASESERLDSISSAVMQDFSLTHKILRLVNSSFYRPSGGEAVSTMSRAIMLLGFETVRSMAIALMLFEHMNDQARADRLREEFVRSGFRGSLARSLQAQIRHHSEEAYLAGMFHRLGRLLALYYFPEEFDEIRRMSELPGQTAAKAEKVVLGITLQDMGIGIARTWGFPDALVRSMSALAPDLPVPRSTPEIELRVIANCSAALGDAFENADPARSAAAVADVVKRYGTSLGISERQVRTAISDASAQTRELADALALKLPKFALGRLLLGMDDSAAAGGHAVEAGRTGAAEGASAASPEGAAAAPATTVAADPDAAQRTQQILTSGLLELSRTLAEQSPLNEVVRLAVETLYRGMALQRVVFALRDPRSNALIGRMGMGAGMPELAKAFRVSLADTGDLFAATANRGADLLIHDAGAANIAARLSSWCVDRFAPGSFVLLPVMVRSNAVGMIYADQPVPEGLRIGEQELQLMRAIRNQVVLALQQARGN